MASFLDYFLPANNGLTPTQTDQANMQGLLGAGSALAAMSAPHAGPQASLLQLVTGGLQGYGSGANDVLKNFYANQATQANLVNSQAGATMAQLQAQRALDYFNPSGKGNNMAAALAPGQPQTGMGAASDGSGQLPSLSSFYGQQVPQVTASELQPPQGGQVPMGKVSGATSQTTRGGPMTAFGVDAPTMARFLYKQGMDTMMLGQTGGDKLIEQAIAMDPSLIYEKAYTNSKGQAEGALPSDLTKIGATGNEARKTAGYEATLRPHDQPVMIGGKLYTIPSNDAAYSQGAVPANLGVAPGTQVSTAIPAGTEELAKSQATDLAQAQKTAVNFDARMQSAQEILAKALESADAAPAGYLTKTRRDLDNTLASVGVPFTNLHLSSGVKSGAYDLLANLNSNLLTQEIPALAQGAGGRVDIPLVNAAKEASQLPMDAAPVNKKKVIQNLLDNLVRVQKSYHNAVNQSNSFTGGATPSISNASGWSAAKVQ